MRHGRYACLGILGLGCTGAHGSLHQTADASLSATGGIVLTGGAPATGGAAGTGGMTATSPSTGGTTTTTTASEDGGCAALRIDAVTASAAFAAASRQLTPDLVPTVAFTVEEKEVPGLWDALAAQLWFGTIANESGGWLRTCSFLYRHCTLTWTNDDCTMFGPIRSGLAADGAFYFSWAPGSGVAYSVLGKLGADGDALARTISPAYLNPSYGPPNLVVAPGTGQILVYRATSVWNQFNVWGNPEVMGTLADFGDRLAIIGNDGRELGQILP
jgi:hypothetical protein